MEIVQYLVEQCHADVNIQDNVMHSHCCIINDTNLCAKDGETPLHAVAHRANQDPIETFKYLIEQCHADVNAKDKVVLKPI